MKKFTLLALAVTALFLATAPNLSAQTESALEWGIVTDKSFSFKPFLWTAGLTLDFYLNPGLSLSPEFFMIVQNLDFGSFFLAPGILLNYQGTDFFMGGGLTKWWLVGSEVEGKDCGGYPSQDFFAVDASMGRDAGLRVLEEARCQ